jgi:hypothetical protein
MVLTIDPMKTAEIRQKLLAWVRERLFGGGRWLADDEIRKALAEKLELFGLEELDDPSTGTLRPTLLGREVNVDLDLITTFLGMWETYEVTYNLYTNGLISDQEKREVEDRMDEVPEVPTDMLRFTGLKEQDYLAAMEAVMLRLVRRAFERAERMGLL